MGTEAIPPEPINLITVHYMILDSHYRKLAPVLQTGPSHYDREAIEFLTD